MTFDEITDLVGRHRDDISRVDLQTIDAMIAKLPADRQPEARQWICEGIALRVSDPLYEGDVRLSDL